MSGKFLKILGSGKLLFLDGAMGTMLQASGMPAGVSPEKFCLANPDILKNIHLAYLAAGCDILTSCTFGANAMKLPADLDVETFNCRMVEIARQAIAESGVSGPRFVAGNVGPTGKFARPLGDVDPGAMIDVFARQIRGLVRGGCDLIFMETQFDLAETRAAVIACRKVCDLPVMVSMTFEHGLSLTGSTPEIFAETMQNLGCDVIGSNCSLGPDEMLPVVRELLRVCSCPVMAEPNAGMPRLEGGHTVFPLQPEEYAEKTSKFAAMGAQVLGGCCGTTPRHMAALVKACAGLAPASRAKPRQSGIVLTSRSCLARIGRSSPLAIIGERINPTGRPELAAALRQGEYSSALKLADEQVEAGASVLDVNVGAPHVDEVKTLPALVELLAGRLLVPLSLDSSSVAALEAALPVCPGSCLINSISGGRERMARLGPLCRVFGSPFILLPLAGAHLPATASKRIEIIEDLLVQAEDLGIPRRLVLVDILALALSSFPAAARECLDVLAWCAARDIPTTVGLSNISFGLPARDLLNATFLAMAAGAGLCSCIANPCAARIAEVAPAIHLLQDHDRDGENFIAAFRGWRPSGAGQAPGQARREAETLYDAVVHGDRENILALLEKDLAAGEEPMRLVNEVLIPAINEVGAKYEKREYFLPQLIRSAEAMRKAFERLKPLLRENGAGLEKPVIVMATVEGDVHDIGKNIVALLLGNHGFDVIDAGKDVPAAAIVECAKKHNAAIIGLSALMTTTMVRMQDTIALLKEQGLPIKVMVGGAAVTREFARSIGADGYSADAVEAVDLAKRLLGLR